MTDYSKGCCGPTEMVSDASTGMPKNMPKSRREQLDGFKRMHEGSPKGVEAASHGTARHLLKMADLESE